MVSITHLGYIKAIQKKKMIIITNKKNNESMNRNNNCSYPEHEQIEIQ